MKTVYSIIYDAFSNQNKYNKVLGEIEYEFVQHGISGRKNKLNALNSLRAITKQEVERGTKNIIIIGNDKTFASVLDFVVPYDVVLGYIPITQPSYFAKLLGIPVGPEACQIISQRLIKKLPMAQINDAYFFNKISLNNLEQPLTITCNNQYNLQTREEHRSQIEVTNFNMEKFQANPKLLLKIESLNKNSLFKKNVGIYDTNISLETISIKSPEPVIVLVDANKELQTPLKISRTNKTLQVMVGKDRLI